MHVSAVHGHRKNAYFQNHSLTWRFLKTRAYRFCRWSQTVSVQFMPCKFFYRISKCGAYCFWKTERKNLRFEKYPDMCGDKALVETNSKNKFVIFDFVLQRFFLFFFFNFLILFFSFAFSFFFFGFQFIFYYIFYVCRCFSLFSFCFCFLFCFVFLFFFLIYSSFLLIFYCSL